MANKLHEGAGSLALAVAENARHRDFEIIVQNRQRHAAEKGKCRDVPIKKSFRRLRRIGLDEAGVRMRQVEAEHMQLHPYAADDAKAFAEVDLRMARRMGQRHEDLARPAAGDTNVILHYGITAGNTVLAPQPFENTLRGVPLLRRRRLIGFRDRVDDRYEQSELRPLRSLGSHIAGRRRIAAHFGNRIPAQSENPRRLAPALPFDEDKPSNRCVNLHREHPRPSLFESDFEKVRPRKWPGFTPPRATALCRRSVAYDCSAAYSLLVDAPDPLQVANIERVLGAAVARMLALELAMGLLLGLGLFQHDELGLGQYRAFLGALGLQRFEPLVHGLEVMTLPHATQPAGETVNPRFLSSLAQASAALEP